MSSISKTLRPAVVLFAGLTILAVMGIALYAIFAAIEKRTTGWANRKTEFSN